MKKNTKRNFNKNIWVLLLLSIIPIIYLYVLRIQNQTEFKSVGAAIPGDCGGPNGVPDGFVDLFDYGNLSRSFGLTQGQPGFDGRCDFHIDQFNIIDLFDYQILANNFGRSGSLTGTVTPPITGTSGSFYVSLTGNDSNPGSAGQPFRTFNKAFSVLRPGNTLYIYGGTYTEKLDISKSGISASPINIRPVSGQRVVIDAGYQSAAPVNVGANISFVNIYGLEVIRSTFECVLLEGSNILINGVDAHDCRKFGYRVKGSSITIENSQCRDSVTENSGGGNTSGGWGSCLKTAPGSRNLTIRNNHVFNNWGEGIIIGQTAGAKVYGNLVHDNYSVNIYIGNTYDVDVYKNMTYSTNSRYFRSGSPANCIAASEEAIPGWGAQLHNIRVFNNIAYSCKTGVGYTYSEVSGNGCQNCLFAFNTLVNTQGIKVIPGTKNSVTIKDNIIQGGSINVPSNSTVSNNLTTDPGFAQTPSTNPQSFRLNASSPAINAGAAIPGITDDYEGKTRAPGYDIGAIEYQ